MDNSNNLPAKVGENKNTKFQKFDKFVTNIKFINYLIFVAIVAFVATFAFVANKISANERARVQAEITERERQELYNQNHIASGGQDIVSEGLTTSTEKQLFTNGKQAVIYAFEKLWSSSMYELKTTGTTVAGAVGVNKTILIQCYGYRFASGVELSQTYRYDSDSIANQTAATETAYKNNKKYLRHGTFVNNNGVYGGIFDSNLVLQSNSKLTGRAFYLINSSTVQKCTAFDITKKDGKISYYTVSVWLDPATSTRNYAQSIMEEAETSYPSFDYINLNCKIDARGNLISFGVVEEMNATKNVPVLGNVNAHTKNSLDTIVVSTNKTPSVAEPNIK